MNRMTPDQAKQWTGLKEGKLNRCPDMKNCVCSQHQDKFYIEPFKVAGDNPLYKVRQLVASSDGYKIEADSGNYLHVTYTSGLMKFVDDVEFLAEPDKGLIHVRSASRLGYWDLGANRKRVEDLRKKLES
ncbi:DUF1499 domain-containing protein [Pseudobacteriovorax antillogorgiicola]|uniref:Uncharacterized conserved protein, DUF1499 family n=1 Tax=Pseudobacteriovorax antillogorgiicola TaxID=1513793 RepID=A0A1Y6BJM8_9BACT|nr:DUF1499 domain-containing protein [Pseudobacteriovorax antillogorgiicola]TCS55526.1 uncharacterized protein (DUF1499 family) [Pseudobacteriovorax antillogorgiicola]SMF11330.1 Uncharacterized conserved protein, DUF1499 family [Pseudobacteriovorax antillogorgiicola]